MRKNLMVVKLMLYCYLLFGSTVSANAQDKLTQEIETAAEVGLLVELTASRFPIQLGILSGKPGESNSPSLSSHFELYANGDVTVTLEGSKPRHQTANSELPITYFVTQQYIDASGSFKWGPDRTFVGGSNIQYFVPMHTRYYFVINGKITMPDNFWDYQTGQYVGIVTATVTAPAPD